MAAIVFDLDGTLIDAAGDITAISNRLLADRGFDPITLADTHSFLGNGAPTFVARLRAARGVGDDQHAAMLGEFVDLYARQFDHTFLFPGVIDALNDLRAAGHHLGICTNKPMEPTRAVLAHLHLTDLFTTVWAGDSLAVRKPDPAPLHAAYQARGAGDGDDRIFVGDSEVDSETALRAGVPFRLYTKGHRKAPAGEIPASLRFDDHADLPGQVAQVLAGL